MLLLKKTNLNLLCDDFQIDGLLNNGVIIWVLLKAKKKQAANQRLWQDKWCLRSLQRGTNHLGRKFLEQLADQTAGWFGVRHQGVEELLQDLLQGGGSILG